MHDRSRCAPHISGHRNMQHFIAMKRPLYAASVKAAPCPAGRKRTVLQLVVAFETYAYNICLGQIVLALANPINKGHIAHMVALKYHHTSPHIATHHSACNTDILTVVRRFVRAKMRTPVRPEVRSRMELFSHDSIAVRTKTY